MRHEAFVRKRHLFLHGLEFHTPAPAPFHCNLVPLARVSIPDNKINFKLQTRLHFEMESIQLPPFSQNHLYFSISGKASSPSFCGDLGRNTAPAVTSPRPSPTRVSAGLVRTARR